MPYPVSPVHVDKYSWDMLAPITDEQITSAMCRMAEGEEAVIEALYDLYADRIYRYILARTGAIEVAQDLTGELFLRVARHIGSFRLDGRRPAASVSAWLYRIAANLVADSHRAGQRKRAASLDDEAERPDGRPGPCEEIERSELLQQLRVALDRLSEEQRLVVIGKFADEMSNQEIADWLGKSEGAIKSLQHRALRSSGRLLRERGK